MIEAAPQESIRAPSLQPLLRSVAPDIEKVEGLLSSELRTDIALIPSIAGHLIAGGGKRIRVALLLGCANLMGYRGERHLLLASAIEFIHTATLLHDDVVDCSDLRRGKPSAHILWGEPLAISVGDYLLSRAFEILVDDGDLDIVRTVADASAKIAAGEVVQLTARQNVEISEDEYFQIISAKTAALFEASCAIAGLLPGGSREVSKAFGAFGQYLGIAFQLVDDAMDYRSSSDRMGKSCGDDFRDGKITLPVLLAYARGSGADREFWRRVMTQDSRSEAELTHANGLLRASGALEETIERARHYGSLAKNSLDRFEPGSQRSALIEAVDFAAFRDF